LLLLDEMEARREALRRGLPVAGMVGVLEKAAKRNLINPSEAFSKLARTSFYIAPQVLQQAATPLASRASMSNRPGPNNK
jgi:predicted nucleic acid-binding protein